MTTAQSTATIAGIDAIYYLAKDFDRARRFYETAFGLRASAEMIGEGGGSFVEYDLPDGTTFGLATMPDSPWHMNGSIEFAVADVDEAVARAKAAGATLNEDLELPTCRMAWLSDTEGNSFCLHRRKV